MFNSLNSKFLLTVSEPSSCQENGFQPGETQSGLGTRRNCYPHLSKANVLIRHTVIANLFLGKRTVFA